ncbi:MAG: hypothetical protein JWN23_242 [Rhodocyclales bacterium]|nr:hypothetical protein [Rhodocyclales bacterium]
MKVYKFVITMLAVGLSLSSVAATAAGETKLDTYSPPPPLLSSIALNQIVEQGFLPQLDYFFDKLLKEKKDIVLDGTKAFNGQDKFLPGKIAIGFSYLLINTPRTDPKFKHYLEGFRQIADMTVDDDNETWGIYYYVSALNKLRKAGLLEEAVSPATLARLKQKLDWRTFVAQPEFTLIKLPTNYYGVAFSIARLRYLLGWEDAQASKTLLEKMVHHYQTYSGEFGFSDETDGDGRFDRYSILLIGEICQRFIETDMEVTPQLKKWLRNSVNVILPRLNPWGNGFEFGRSIGAYGDTSFLEVLSAAAKLGVLNKEEREMAYAFAVRSAAKYQEFWFDQETHSVNLWDKGRRTDAYRGKYRILGENLSLLHQEIYTNNIWNSIGFKGKTPSANFVPWLTKQPRFTLTWFAKGEYDRALLTFRDGFRIVSLPMVNGGVSQHMNNPYSPIPFSNNMVQGSADAGFPQLIPRFTLADGSQLIPVSFIKDIKTEQKGSALTLSYRMDELDKLGERTPVKDARLKVETTYTLDSGVITRNDRYTPQGSLDGVKIAFEFAGFSEDAVADGNTIRFGKGDAQSIEVSGLDRCKVESVAGNEVYRSPMRAMNTRVTCESGPTTLNKPFTIAWTLRYH